MLGIWQRFRSWRRDSAIRQYENDSARKAAEERRFDARAQTRRPQGSGRPTTYDQGHTDDRF